MAPFRSGRDGKSFQLVAGACLLAVVIQTCAGLQQLAGLPPPPAANFAQLARTPASSLLLNEFLLHEKQRVSQLPPGIGGGGAPLASAAASTASRPSAPKVPQVSALLPADQPGSLLSATPTYSQALANRPGQPPFRLDQYHPLEEIYAYLTALAKHHPKRVHLFTIGHTSEQRPIKALELINNVTDPDYIWLDALTHAREWITGTTLLYTIDKLVAAGPASAATSAASSSSSGRLMQSKNFIIIPVVNPDGYAFTWSTNRMWRKNRSKSSATSLTRVVSDPKSCIGSDLNRNFDHSFGGEGASSDPCSHIYSGAFPFSEPETRALADLMWSLRDRIKFYLTMHSFNQLWACPYAHTTEQSAHLAQHMRVLRSIQQAVYQTEGVHYEIGPLSTSLYVGSGFGIDFAYDKCAIVHAYLVELRDRGANGFVLPADQILPTARETFAGLRAGLRAVFGA